MSIDDRISLWQLCRCFASHVHLRSVLLDEEGRRLRWNDYKTDMSEWCSDRIVDALFSLARSGQILFWHMAAERGARAREIPLKDVVDAYDEDRSFRRASLYYGFSKEGANEWERRFQPDWNRFHTTRLSESDANPVSFKALIVAGSPEQCCQMLGALPDYMGCDKRFGLRELRTGESKNWRATYWKALDTAFFARVTAQFALSSKSLLGREFLKRTFLPLEQTIVIS